MSSKRIAVLGGGMSGLTSVKACLEEGLEPVCFESTDNVGGLWRYRPQDLDGVSSLPKSTIINTSKEPSAFSDFPPPKDFPNYMHNRYMFQYFNLYADHFGLRKYIRFNRKVTWVSPTDDYNETGRWSVTVTKTTGNVSEPETEVFDGVMICTGHHVYPYLPKFEGMNDFRGKVLHTHSYKVPNEFEGNRVLVIGNGNSGSDAAVELSSIADQVYLSTRRGFWIRYRLGPRGYPGDLTVRTRASVLNLLPFNIKCNLQEKRAMEILDYDRYGLKASHRILSQHPTVSDALPNKILSGSVKIKGPIAKFVPAGVIFEGDEETMVALDAVILATGYRVNFPFLDPSIAKLNDEECELYLYVFPPRLKRSTLAFIGNVQPIGPMFLISELQARWYAQVFNGKAKLPTMEVMLENIKMKAAINSKVFISGSRHVTEVIVIPYCDEIASKFGAKPNLLKLLFTDYPLFKVCFFKAHLAYQYRLNGPHPWSGAREALLTYEDRVMAAFDTNAKLVKSRKRVVVKSSLIEDFTIWFRPLLFFFFSAVCALYIMKLI